MKQLTTLLYNIALQVYYLAIKISANFHPKARQWLAGRPNNFTKLPSHFPEKEKRIWIHCASLGEFEQGRPIIESLKTQYPNYKILLTFFSPSGYEIRKNYKYADYILYLPLDTPKNAQQFIEKVQPSLLILVKYEFWLHHLNKTYEQKIPIILISAIFRPNQIFFKWYGHLFRDLLHQFYHIFVQNESSAKLVQELGIQQVSIAGDTRFDRVFTHQQTAKKLPIIANFKGSKRLVVAGSTWPKDEILLAQLINSSDDKIKFIIAPHEIKNTAIQQFQKRLNPSKKSIRFSEIKQHFPTEIPISTDFFKAYDVLIIDNIGMLATIYQYGDYAYIGGGFGKGIHNILEAAVFGMPIFFGKNYQKFQEAKDLIKLKGAFTINTFEELKDIFTQLETNPNFYQKTAETSTQYINSNIGGTTKIMGLVREIL